MRYTRTDTKLIEKALKDGIDPHTIQIPSGLRCNKISFCFLVDTTQHNPRGSVVLANDATSFDSDFA